jgi:hypothetical protein
MFGNADNIWSTPDIARLALCITTSAVGRRRTVEREKEARHCRIGAEERDKPSAAGFGDSFKGTCLLITPQ